MNELKEFQNWVNESNAHISKTDLEEHFASLKNWIESAHARFFNPAFRQRIEGLIEQQTGLKYPESMHLTKDVNDAIKDILSVFD